MFPTNEVKKKKVALKIIADIDRLGKRAAMAHATPVLSNLKTLYYLCKNMAENFLELESEGLTADVLGPIVAAEWGFNWEQYSDAFQELKTVAIPSVVQVIIANKNEILARDFGSTGIFDKKISGDTEKAIKTEIQKITALIPG